MIIAVVYGLLAAASLGTSDFLARFTSQRLGTLPALTFVVLIGAVLMSVLVATKGEARPLTAAGVGLSAAHGLAVVAMSAMLFAALARGPVSLAVPIVAAHPVLVLAWGVLVGTTPLSASQGMAALVVTGGVVASSMFGLHGEPGGSGGRGRTLALAAGASLAYALLIILGQAAAADVGELQATWLGRLAGATVLLGALAARVFTLARPRGSWPMVASQGALDTGGYLALLAGGVTAFPGISAVVGSTFGFLTIVLGRLVIRERISFGQWASILVSFAGIAWLVAGH